MALCVARLLRWIFREDLIAQLLTHLVAVGIIAHFRQRKKFGSLLRFVVRHMFTRKKSKPDLDDLVEQSLEEMETTLKGGGAQAKKIMEFMARLPSIMGEIRKLTQQKEAAALASLQKDFIIAFLVTLVVILLGFSGVAWSLHILDVYQLVDKGGMATHSLLTYIYFTMVTISTVGYGDVVPGNDLARMFAMVQIFAGFFLIVIVIASFANITARLNRMQREEWVSSSKRQQDRRPLNDSQRKRKNTEDQDNKELRE